MLAFLRRNAIALLALFVALGGASYAAIRLPANSVGTRELRDNAVTAAKVKDRSLRAGDFARGQLQRGRTGPPGAPGRSALSPLRSGETIRGAWSLRGGDDPRRNTATTSITFSIPAPQPVDAKHVVIAGNDTVAGDGCTGSAASPEAGPGFVCVYAAVAESTVRAFGYGARGSRTDALATNDGSSYGFGLVVEGTAGFQANGTWAYRAP